jgi:hypothetical protein
MRRVPEEPSVGKLGLAFGLNELIAAFVAGLRGDVTDGAMKAHFILMKKRDSPEWHLVKDWVLIMNELCHVSGEGFLSLIVEVG